MNDILGVEDLNIGMFILGVEDLNFDVYFKFGHLEDLNFDIYLTLDFELNIYFHCLWWFY